MDEMKLRYSLIGATIAAAAALGASVSAQAGTIFVDMGQSAENFTLYGMGASPANMGFGTYTIGQGSSVFDGVTSTFTLSGNITGGGSPGYTSGTYAFVTTYDGADTPTGGPNAPQAFSNPASPEEFFYSSLAPSTSMTLDLFGTPSGDHVIPLVTNGNFDGPGFSFAFASTMCTGVATCDQALVGLTPGSSIFGPVTISVSVTTVPEPATWAMMLVGFGGLGAAMRARRRQAVAA
jgi:hypothetical protein